MSTIRSEDLQERLKGLYEQANDAGEAAERAARDAGVEIRVFGNKPDLSARWKDQLDALIDQELTVARPVEGEALIEEREREREIGKRALAHLKLAQLRQIAADRGLLTEGDLDDVSDRIVREFRADRQEIAQLVVRYEQEPPPERRFATRLFQLAEPASDIEATAARVSLFAGRYTRTGIARWFVIRSVDSSPSRLKVSGTFESYRAKAQQEAVSESDTGEDAADRFDLVSERDTADVELSLDANSAFVLVEGRGTTESKAAIQAFEHASGLKWKRSLLMAGKAPEGDLLQWDTRSVFMVDLLSSRFRSTDIEVSNLAVAGFQTDRGSAKGEEAKPRVKAVRFQGQHLLDSRPACELLVRGEALVELGMTVRFRADGEHRYSFPLNIRLERDHATIMTGFGDNPVSVARTVQNTIAAGTISALKNGLEDESALKLLAAQISKRANSEEPVERATLFVAADAEHASNRSELASDPPDGT